jgi:4-amino-4-deoxy-L-arabinose transferase-like glycosyltransferase
MHLGFLDMPLHWDEDAYFGGAHEIYKNNLNPFVEFWSYKPPLMFELTAVLFKVFSPARYWGRLITLIFSCFSLLFIYLLGKEVVNKRVGFLSAVMLFFYPQFMAQSFLFQTPVFLTCLTLSTLYFYFSKQLVFYLLSAGLFVLTKEPAVLVILFLSLFHFWKYFRRKKTKEVLKECLLTASPIIIFLGWMLLNKHFLGWYLWPYNVNYFQLTEGNFLDLEFEFVDALANYFLWIIFSLLFSGLFFSFSVFDFKKRFFKKEHLFFGGMFFFFFFFFAWGAFRVRYLLFVYPLIFISFVSLIVSIFDKKKASLFVYFVCMLFLLTNLYNSFFLESLPQYEGERDLSFLRIISYRNDFAKHFEKNYPDGLIIANWPYLRILGNPFLGYINKKRVVMSCQTREEKKAIQEYISNMTNEKTAMYLIISERPFESNFCFSKSKFRLINLYNNVSFSEAKPIKIYQLKEDEEIN